MLKNIITKLFPNLSKLEKVASVIDHIVVDKNDSIYVKFKKDLILETEGNFINFSKAGWCVTKHKLTHTNPDVNVEFFENFARRLESDAVKNECNLAAKRVLEKMTEDHKAHLIEQKELIKEIILELDNKDK